MSAADRTPLLDAVEVDLAVQELRVREAAAARFRRERAGDLAIPRVLTLPELLAAPDEPVMYRVDGILPHNANVLLAAQAKAGKSTMIGNLIRSLADAEPFLGAFDTQAAGRVTLIDDELHESTLRRWMRGFGIKNPTAVQVASLRGRVSAFDIRDDETRLRWAQLIAGTEVLVLDCLRPILDAIGLDEHRQAGQFLVALDALKAEAGIRELVLVHHMGHEGKRSRGDSRLLDWPDVLWTLTRTDPEDPSSPRYFQGYGRDVDVPEGVITFDPNTRDLTYSAGSRKDAEAEALIPDLLAVMSASECAAMSGREIETAMAERGHPRALIRRTRDLAHSRGVIRSTPGPRNAQIWSCA